ncbi:hypothetical protein [Flavobacterium hibisci]|uniref:hypothetical protein n=1 Tax=Flavobacterium hibisci TaxID=1914462 RepID=UPI001CC0F60A|nr:hypothetical protein [Flavobacterium hibisci]MBZ4041356.1 hypothetical protein [Flavobacterium hibisci]
MSSFLDYNMSYANGQDFIAQITDETLKDIPFILYSAYSKEAAENILLTTGNECFIILKI